MSGAVADSIMTARELRAVREALWQAACRELRQASDLFSQAAAHRKHADELLEKHRLLTKAAAVREAG